MFSATAREAERLYCHQTPRHLTDSESGTVWPPISSDCDVVGFWPTFTTSSFCALSLRHDELVKFVIISFCLAMVCFVVAQVLTSSAWIAAPFRERACAHERGRGGRDFPYGLVHETTA